MLASVRMLASVVLVHALTCSLIGSGMQLCGQPFFGQHHIQIDYILAKKCFQSGVNIARTQSFPGADIGSDHDLLMMTFRLRLKKISKAKHTRLKFDLEKLKDLNVLETFQAMIGGRFAPLIIMSNEDTDIESMITSD